MANQTVTTSVNYDSASISGLLNGETLTINGGSVTIDADVRWNQQAAVLGPVTLSSTLGGSFVIDGSQVWEVPFSASSGNVPTQGALGTNGVTGGMSGATGEMTRVWATGSLDPAAAGGAMPATGFIKLRSKTGTFQSGETITLPGGATITASGAGKRSWIHVVGREASSINVPRLGNFALTGDWYDLATTNGLDDQIVQFPVADECPALQIETAPGSGVYEWWLNAGRKWVGQVQIHTQAVANMTETVNIATRPPYNDPAGFLHTARQLKETATTAVHITSNSIAATATETGIYKLRTYLKKDTRRWGFAQIATGVSNGDRYGVIVDFDAAGAVVATPTVGTPLNAGHTVTSIGGGWFLVELTINVATLAAGGLIGTIGASNSATPTLVSGQPSYLGVTTEGIWYTEIQLIAPASIQYVNSTDERGKFFFSNPQTGAIIFAERTARTAGLKPASGCKIRIPNVICSNAPIIDYSINAVQVPGGTPGRYGFVTTSAGVLNISHATLNWYLAVGSAFSVTLQNSALTAWNSFSAGSAQTYNNLGIGISRDSTSSGFLTISSTQTGGTITDVRACRDQINNATLTLSACANFTVTRARIETFGNNQGRVGRIAAPGAGVNASNCSKLVFDDCTIVGTSISLTTCGEVVATNTKYAERITGETASNDGGYVFSISTSCSDILVDGVSLITGLTNVHPQAQIVIASTNCSELDIRNIGTPTAPFNGGSTAQMVNAVRLSGTVFNSAVRRVYCENLSSIAITHNATNQNIELVNFWSDGADALNTVVGLNVIAKGCRWSNAGAAQNAVYGVHWEDAFTGPTSGRITISANEPLPETADQCSASFGVNAGFTSGGGAFMPNVGDEIVWTMPYYALGHTGIAQFSYGSSATETWLNNATNPQNFEFTYQIDKGSGFSAWKPLIDIVRRSAGGAGNTNTITVNSADWDALTHKPVVGDYIVMATGNRLPANTTITNIAGYVLTLSNNFIASVGSEVIYFYKDIRDEVINPATGYRLKIKCRANTANTSNLFNSLRIPFDTNSTDQQIQYPLPGSQVTVNGLVSGSRVKVTRVDTGAFLAQATSVTNAVNFDIPYEGAVRIEARNASGATAYKPWVTQTTISTSAATVVTALQETD